MADRFPDIPRQAIDDTPGARLRTALSLYAPGMDIMRQRLRRENPDWNSEQVEQALRTWRLEKGLDGWGPGFTVKRWNIPARPPSTS